MSRSATQQVCADAERARALFSYDPETGIFTRKVRGRGRNSAVGDVAGQLHPSGYRKIRFGGPKVRAHRLAWLIMTGRWPRHEIDHRNGDKADNRWSNLREATRSQNLWNMRVSSRSASGVKGVSQKGDRWRAAIRVNGRAVHVGTFSDVGSAAAAIRAARAQLHGEFANHG
jgi:hypothetical protein